MAKKSSKFIQGAIKHKGALTRKAKAAGKSISSYCAGGSKLSTQSQRQCNFAKELSGFSRGKKKK